MKTILSAQNVKEADKLSEKHGIPTESLMQNAGRSVVEFISKNLNNKKNIYVLCGSGNNGGDGFVAAKLLKQNGLEVKVALIGDFRKISPLCKNAMESALSENIEPENFNLEDAQNSDLIIDAIFGIGLKRNIEGEIADIISAINKIKKIKISIDIPSGISADTGEIMGTAFEADYTITFQRPKIGNLLLPGKEYCGTLITEDIGIPSEVMEKLEVSAIENNPDIWKNFLPKPKLSDHKYKKGHVLVDGGIIDSTGAAKLAATSALRIGAGLVTIASDEASLPIYSSSLTSVMVKQAKQPERFKKFISERKVNTCIIGPASGVGRDTADRTLIALEKNVPCVIDADAITSFESNRAELFLHLKHNGKSVLTPHEGEFARLFPELKNKNKLEKATQAAEISGAAIVLKGNDTIIASAEGKIVINTNAPVYLATAGSGDVLSGIIGGLIAQGMPAFEASCAGVYIHSETANKLGKGMIAEDMPVNLGKIINTII